MGLEFSWQFFEKSSNIKFYKDPLGGRRVVTSGPKDVHDEANGRFSQVSLTRSKKTETQFTKHMYYTVAQISTLVFYVKEASFLDSIDGLQIQMLTVRLPQRMVE